MPMDITRPVEVPKTAKEDEVLKLTCDKVRPEGWPEDEYFWILKNKERGLTLQAKQDSYDEYKDFKGRTKYRQNIEKTVTNVVSAHLKGWNIRAGADTDDEFKVRDPEGKIIASDTAPYGWLKYCPETVEFMKEGPFSFLMGEVDSRAGWVENIEVVVSTPSGKSKSGV